jgi:hypothetical protein
MWLSLLIFGGQVMTTYQKQTTPLSEGGQGVCTPLKSGQRPQINNVVNVRPLS